MDILGILWIIVLVFGLTSLVATLVSKMKVRSGQQNLYPDRKLVMPTVREVIRASGGSTLWGIAGELDPRFYAEILSELTDGVENRDMKMEFVCGPRIVIEDVQYELYVEKGTYKPGYWKAHPIVRLAHDFADSGKVKLYIKHRDSVREETHCFCSVNEAAPCITERGHLELLPSPVLVERETRVGWESLRARFEEAILSGEAILWQPLRVGAESQIRFIRYSEMLEEATQTMGSTTIHHGGPVA